MLVIVLLILVVAITLVPLIVLYTQSESKWSVKQGQTTRAFHLAEAALERGYLEITSSTETWDNVQKGQNIAGYRFDVDYTDLDGGDYAIWIGSGSGTQTALIIGIGRDTNKKEVRTLESLYSKLSFGNVAIQANNGVSITGNNFEVEWGAILTPKSITANGRTYPQFWSATSIDLDSNGSTPPNCDTPNCCQWHSYSTNIPPLPTIDLDFYRSSASAAGTGPCGSYYSSASRSMSSCVDLSGNAYYTAGDLTMSNNNHIIGDLIVTGNLNLPNGNYGNGNETISVPQEAWKQYCQDWSHYQTFDGGAASSWPGVTSTYKSASTLTYSGISKAFLHGLLYVGGDITQSGGGGNGDIIGAAIVGGAANLGANSHATIWYNSDVAAAMHTSTLVLGRQTWQEISWPSFPFP